MLEAGNRARQRRTRSIRTRVWPLPAPGSSVHRSGTRKRRVTTASTRKSTSRPPIAHAGTGFLFNYAWWADNRDELDARFQSWLGQ